MNFPGVSEKGYLRDLRALNPSIPEGTEMLIVNILVLENGVWKKKNGWVKLNLQKGQTKKEKSQDTKKEQQKEFTNIQLDQDPNQDW